jgi:hypothetical protein
MRPPECSSKRRARSARTAIRLDPSLRPVGAPPREAEEFMATMYLMSLEDRLELARNQLDFVIQNLRSVKEQSRPAEIQQLVSFATTKLEHISEIIRL